MDTITLYLKILKNVPSHPLDDIIKIRKFNNDTRPFHFYDGKIELVSVAFEL